MEASVQDGRTRAAGAVLGLQTTRHPISAARAVMERTRHVALASCDAWCAQQGLEQQPVVWFDTSDRLEQLEAARKSDAVRLDHEDEAPPGSKMGTVGAVALDVEGNLAAATSTGGMTNKMVGRVGDTPVIGAGTHACRHCAVSGTGRGEQFLRHAVAGAIGTRVAMGTSLQAACAALVHHTLEPGDGGVIAIDSRGNIEMPFNTPGMFRGWVRDGEGEADGKPQVAIYTAPPPPSSSLAAAPSAALPPASESLAEGSGGGGKWLGGKTVLVTGGAFGIGRAIVLRAARLGAAVIVADLPIERWGGEATAAEARRVGAPTAVFVGCDVSDGAQVQRTVAQGVEACGQRLDAVFANAGIGSGKGWAHELPDAAFARTVGVNLCGAFHTAKYTLPHLVATQGSLVFTASSFGLVAALCDRLLRLQGGSRPPLPAARARLRPPRRARQRHLPGLRAQRDGAERPRRERRARAQRRRAARRPAGDLAGGCDGGVGEAGRGGGEAASRAAGGARRDRRSRPLSGERGRVLRHGRRPAGRRRMRHHL